MATTKLWQFRLKLTSEAHSCKVPTTGMSTSTQSVASRLPSSGTAPVLSRALEKKKSAKFQYHIQKLVVHDTLINWHTILLLLLFEQLHRPRAALRATSWSVCSPVMGLPGRPGFTIKFTCRHMYWILQWTPSTIEPLNETLCVASSTCTYYMYIINNMMMYSFCIQPKRLHVHGMWEAFSAHASHWVI